MVAIFMEFSFDRSNLYLVKDIPSLINFLNVVLIIYNYIHLSNSIVFIRRNKFSPNILDHIIIKLHRNMF
ncbi:hypothetical protein CNEO3_450002 [Clostridium neonatale]|uniref:Uncharacterized protein n=1 Tax=Clostridium neonatale TaxID=137838 RepID=A0AA86MLH2_9CLOT|nr:hypothetical protein CNEO_41280 [Clostridium neonatale]CAI3575474.1 hypothetical protein CNEO4_200013 [Clostridium neonatale]CAI3588165.1 hypothetical protein CNEO3_350012 [Clostridium neonatale]CAI3630799.1 hypothetical protein CNEO3_290012 [Clostridium neonatale]CAI3631326.1 hypothetical protein CNEO3_310012 [Clostridium neonatale]